MIHHSDPWVIIPRPRPEAAIRLFCFPYAGGNASVFYPWLDAVPREIEISLVQPPGRGRRLAEAPYADLNLLVQMLAEIFERYLDKPCAFFGHSMGALLCFELARQLRQRYRILPKHLFVSAHRAPQLPARYPPIHHLPELAFIDELGTFHGTPEIILHDKEFMNLILPTLRADFTLCETYTYQPQEPLACSISALGGVDDTLVNQDELDAWRVQTSTSFTRHLFPGHHFYFQQGGQPLLLIIVNRLLALACVPPHSEKM